MPQLPLSDAAIYYQEYGRGVPLLLLHAGWGLGINGFAYQQDALADEFRMIVPDRRGYGRSEKIYHDPTVLPVAAQTRLAQYHGQDTWQQVIRNWAGAWLELGRREGDLYRGRLHEITCPALVIHGDQDEHTLVSEREELTRRIPGARLSVYPQAGHCVHDARLHCANCTQEARRFLRACPNIQDAPQICHSERR
jgi:pimeloyl-ACP methyl ester carboxylesterase